MAYRWSAIALIVSGCGSEKTPPPPPPPSKDAAAVEDKRDVSLDRVVNEMLIATAKSIGADKVVNIKVDITPDGGIWTLRRILGWRSAEASGVAVIIEPESTP